MLHHWLVGSEQSSRDPRKCLPSCLRIYLHVLFELCPCLRNDFPPFAGHLGAVFRTVLETMRTLCVWLVDLGLFYTPLGFGQLGESWSQYSLLQAAGFVVLVGGTLVYGRGDEEGAKQELQEAVADALGEAEGQEAAAQRPVASAAQSRPISAARALTAPISMRQSPVLSSSFKATYNIMSASYSSYRGSVSRSLPQRPPANVMATGDENGDQ